MKRSLIGFAAMLFCIGSAEAAWLWKGGGGNNDWTNNDNWWSKNVASGTLAGHSGYYFWGKRSVGENLGPIEGYTVNVNSAQSLSDYFFINFTSTDKPVVITSSAGDVGITNSKNLNIGWGNSGNEYGDGHLKFVRGTHNFPHVQLGQEKADPDTSGTLILAGENGTLNLTATGDLRIFKGKAVVSRATLNVNGMFKLGNSYSGNCAEFVQDSGTVAAGGYVCIGGNGGVGVFRMNGGTLSFNRSTDDGYGSVSVGFGSGADCSYFYHNGGNTTVAGNFNIARDGAGEFYMNGGTVTVGGKTVFGAWYLDSDERCYLNLNGGVFSTPYLNFHNGDGVANVVFNGGTLKITQSGDMVRGDKIGSSESTDFSKKDNLAKRVKVSVASQGGTIDAGGNDVVMPLDILEDSSSAGGSMAFVGGGTVTLGGAVGWKGGTVIAAGTIVKVDSAEKKNALFGNGRITVIPSHAGTCTVVEITGDGTFDESDLGKVAVADGYASFSISEDKKSIMMAAYGEINQKSRLLVFPGASLDDLSTHTLRARMKGDSFAAKGSEVTFFNRTETTDGGALKVTYQLQALDDSGDKYHYVKAVKVEFTEDSVGVYAKLIDGKYSNYGTQDQFGTDPLTDNSGSGNYIPYDFRMVEPVSDSINVNFTNGNDLETTSSVRYGAGDYAVPYTMWVNMPVSGSTSQEIGGAVFKITGQQGAYKCEYLNSEADVRYGYIDDSNNKPNPTVTISEVPYDFYRIVVYASGDGGNKQYGYVTMNGVNYSASGNALESDTVTTVPGTGAWGKTSDKKGGYLYGLKEGLNYLVSPVTHGSTAVITANRISSSARANIAAVQIVEYCPETYTATIDEGGELSLASLVWNKALPQLLTPEDALVVNVNADATLAVESELDLAAIYFNVAEGKTLTLAGSPIAAKWIKVSGAGQVVTTNSIQFIGAVKGDGTIVYDGCKPIGASFTDTAWKGTLWVKNIESTSEMRKDWALQNYGNAGSTLRFSNANIYFPSSTGTSFAGTVDVYGEGVNICDGYSGSVATIARLTGSGDFVVSGGSSSESGNGITIKDVSGFAGTFSLARAKVVIGNSTGTSPAGVLQIDSGYAATIPAGKTWTAAGGVILNGTLAIGDDAFAPAVESGTGTIRVESGTGTFAGCALAASPKLETAEGATLAVSNANLAEMTLGGLDNAGVINLRETSLERLAVALSSEEKNIESGEILWPTTFKRFVVVPADGAIRSFEGYDALEETLPEGAAYYVQVSATNEEFGKGSVEIKNASDGVNLCVAQPDGTFAYAPSYGGVAQYSSALQIAGSATVFDFTYTNTTDCAYRAPGWNVGWDADTKPMTFNNELADETTGIYIKHHPWYTDIGTKIKELDDFTLVVVGTMSPSKNTQFIHLGSSVNDIKTGLLITTTENEDEVLIAKNDGASVDAANGVKASVPNAAKARHAYIIKKSGSVFEVWVDGIKRGTFDVGAEFKLAAGGIQVGADHGAKIREERIYNAVPVNDSETGVLNVFRLYDYSLSEAQVEAISAAYPYVSQGGLYTRTLAAGGSFEEDGSWTKDGEDGAYSLPQGAEVDGVVYNPSATLEVQSEAALAVNANVVIDTFTVGGDATVNFAKVSGYSATVGGAAVINSPVKIEYGALNISGAPLQLGSAGAICFDCTKVDVSRIYVVTHIQLTGIVERDDGKITLLPPTDETRRSELAYNPASQCYELLVTPLRDYVVAGNLNTSLEVTEDTVVVGEGGFKLDSLSFPENARLEIDPVKSPVYVSSAPQFGAGAKIRLPAAYSQMTLGRVVLMTWSGDAELPEDLDSLFDSSTVASGAVASLAVKTAPNGSANQLILTVGDYDSAAKEIRITAIGDSITQGVGNGNYGNPQYRTAIAARLAAMGYKPKMLGIWKVSNWDSAGILQPEDWAWHSGISGDRIITGDGRGGVRDNIYRFLDVAGDVNAMTLLIGTNDIGAGRDAATVYAAYKNLIFEAARLRPNAKIFGATILDRNDGDDAADTRGKIAAFNALLRADYEEGNLPSGYVLLDLFEEVPITYGQNGNFSTDALHLNWVGCSVISEAFAAAIAEALPLAGEGALSGAADPSVTAEPQNALGAEATVPAEYRSGMQKIFAIDASQSVNDFSGCAPYTTTNVEVSVNRQVTKAGYYMELVRKGTNRRRYVWVDFDATGKTLDEIDFPWSGANMDFVLEKLHVYSNDPSVHIIEASDDSAVGVVEGTHYNYSNGDDAADKRVPEDLMDYGWNDKLGSSGGYGGFQVHRLFSQPEDAEVHWNNAEVLFAWNAWGSSKKDDVDEIGIGSFVKSRTLGGSSSMDYTFMSEATDGAVDTLSAKAYQVVHFEVWANVVLPQNPVCGKWIGGFGPKMSIPGNWDDNRVPAKGEALDFTDAVSGEVVEADLDVEFASIAMGSELVTFTGNLATKAIVNAEKVAVGQDSTVSVYGDLRVNRTKESDSDKVCIVGKIGEGGKFVVTGTLHIDVNGVYPAVYTSAGYIVVNALKLNNVDDVENLYSTKDGTSQKWVIGKGGISGFGGIWCRSNKNNDCILQPDASDFTVDVWTVVRDAIDSHELLTTGFGDGLAHVIRLDGGFSDKGKLIVSGKGKVVVNHVTEEYGGKKAYSGAVSVTDTATLAINAGMKLTSGKITVSSGAALEIAQSGTVDLGGDLTLEEGAVLAFNYSRGPTPHLNLNGKTFTAPSTVKVRISAGDKVHPRSGLNILTSGGGFAGKTLVPADGEYPKWLLSLSVNDDGNIVADVEATGFFISIR